MKTGMYLKILKRSILGFILFLTLQLQAQEKDNGTLTTLSGENASKDTVKTFTTESEWLPAYSLYIELGGKLWYSLNIDFRKRENFALSIGISYLEDEDANTKEYYQSLFNPSVMCYYLGGERHRFELGGGLSSLIGSSQGLTAMMLHGVVGYRYQKKKGLIFRAGFTPFITIPIAEDVNSGVFPWAGVSLGYSF